MVTLEAFCPLANFPSRVICLIYGIFAQSTEEPIENIAERWVKSNILDLSTDTSYCTTTYDAAVKALSE